MSTPIDKLAEYIGKSTLRTLASELGAVRQKVNLNLEKQLMRSRKGTLTTLQIAAIVEELEKNGKVALMVVGPHQEVLFKRKIKEYILSVGKDEKLVDKIDFINSAIAGKADGLNYSHVFMD